MDMNPKHTFEAGVPDLNAKAGAIGRDRSIGAILVDTGRLKPEEAEVILREQKQKGLRFGEAALALKLVTQADIDFALSQQFEYAYLLPGDDSVSQDVVAAFQPFSPIVEQLRGLRSQLMLRWFGSDPEQRALAVVSPDRGDGRSFIAANLAVVFSQLGERTLLIDADLRHPCQHKLFNLENKTGTSAILAGRAGLDAIVRIPSLRDLSVLPAGATPPNPQELLVRAQCTQLVEDVCKEFDVVIFDTPPASQAADAQIVAVRTSAALLAVRKNVSKLLDAQNLVNGLTQASARVVGAVVSDF